jgi:FAD/FMN-containing dehydrogenase
MDIPFNKVELELMRNIKKIFDSKNILNPNKMF